MFKYFLTFSGLNNVLTNIVITSKDPHYIFIGRGYFKTDDSMAWTIGVKTQFWSEVQPGTELSILVTSTVTGQNQLIPIKVTFRGDQCANIELGWTVLLYFFAAHYQALLFIGEFLTIASTMAN